MKKGFLVLLFLPLLMIACSRPVAEVNGEPINKKDYLRELEERRLFAGSIVDELTLKNIVIDSLIEERLILSEAGRRNIKVTPEEIESRYKSFKSSFPSEDEFRKYMKRLDLNEKTLKKRLEEKLKIDKFILSMADLFSVSLEEVKKEYQIQKPLKEPEKVKISMMEFTDKVFADNVLNEIKDKGFESVIEKLKDRKDVAVTEPRWITLSLFLMDIQDVLRKAQVGKVIGPFKRNDSWYIIKIYDKKAAQFKTFDEAKTEIMFNLLHKKRLSALQQWLKEKKSSSKIVIYAGRL